ncbi:MAG: hypothetical protein ACKV19_06995 [Verrucomicrobiales bacterium]
MRKLAVIIFVAGCIAAGVSTLVGRWIGIPQAEPTYRRIGPSEGPQVFCGGSSLVQMGIEWGAVSRSLNRGVENWGIGGSTPEIWEASQKLSVHSDCAIIGVSLYDLNEHRLCDVRANLVPLHGTLRDLWRSHAGWPLAKRIISQYPLALVRTFFPTAGRSDAVLVGLRERVRSIAGLETAKEDQARALVLPPKGLLKFGDNATKLGDLSEGRLRRRLAMMRADCQGQHDFDGPKMEALKRMIRTGSINGRVIIVVMPVSPAYQGEFAHEKVGTKFEQSIKRIDAENPSVEIVRLDVLSTLASNEYFSDPVHLNGEGRRIATEAFLQAIEPPNKGQ